MLEGMVSCWFLIKGNGSVRKIKHGRGRKKTFTTVAGSSKTGDGKGRSFRRFVFSGQIVRCAEAGTSSQTCGNANGRGHSGRPGR
jgi:hypothetical protein